MRRRRFLRPAAVQAGAILVTLVAGASLVASGGTTRLWSVTGSSGNASSSESHRLGSTTGQSPIGVSGNDSGGLCAGFWCGAALVTPVPTATSTATPTISPTPTKDPTVDTDGDGCTDVAEQQPKSFAQQGGGRNPKYFWDVYDTDTENGLSAGTALTGIVTVGDVFAVAGHFGGTGDPGIDPLSDASGAGYHTRFDRGDIIGPNNWNRAPADGAITIGDIFAVAAQFGLHCS